MYNKLIVSIFKTTLKELGVNISNVEIEDNNPFMVSYIRIDAIDKNYGIKTYNVPLHNLQDISLGQLMQSILDVKRELE